MSLERCEDGVAAFAGMLAGKRLLRFARNDTKTSVIARERSDRGNLVPASPTRFPRAGFLFSPLLVLLAMTAAFADPAALVFTQAGPETYAFDTGVLRGGLRAEGKSVGLLAFEHTATKTRLDGNDYGLMSHYRVFTANRRYGGGAWYWPSTSRLLPGGAVEVRWAPEEGRPFEMTAVYRWAAPDTLDLTTSVTAKEDLKGFESFLASYFTKDFPSATVCVKDGPEGKPAFRSTPESAGPWQVFPRDAAAVALIQDGRWKIEPNPVDWAVRDELYAPLIIRRNQDTGVCAVFMAPREDSFGVMSPCEGEAHYSCYLNQIGRDVKAGETVSARARLVVRPLAKDEEALALYDAYLRELAAP